MEIPGFTLSLQDYCQYCPDFEPQIETCGYSLLSGSRCHHNICCVNARRCAHIAENLSKRVTK